MTSAELGLDGELSPRVIVFAGPNGSGKSTINRRVLQDPALNFQGEYINADEIAKGLEATIADRQSRDIKAAELAEQRRETAIKEHRPFAFETVMSTPEKIGLMTQAKAKGYDVTLVFVSTSDPQLNVARIANRVAQDGHPVAPETVHRRYHSAMALLPCAVEHADAALVVDNSGASPVDVALKADGQLHQLADNAPAWVAEKLVKPYKAREASRAQIDKTFEQLCAGGTASLPAVLADADASNGKTYRGKLVEVTPHHALQQIGANKFVIHDRTLSVDQDLKKGKQAVIGYAYEKGKIVAPSLEKSPPSRSRGR